MSNKMSELDSKHDSLADAFHTFKARMILHLEDKAITGMAKQATKIKIAIGDKGIR